ncbi:MAG TPA: FtsX-like permease family protein, partial [Chitinophaga sp.]|nr:FtsX-like permease family protein [Chitinophaga sp.]
AISRRVATLLFGSPGKAMGKTVRFENSVDLTVNAVFEDMPANSSRHLDFLRSWQAYVKENPWVTNWNSASPASFVQLRPDADPAKVEAKIKNFIYRYTSRDNNSYSELGLQPYTTTYLQSIFRNGQIDGGRIEYVKLFTLIAAFILLIACINFMNLATARSTKRAKEVGIRKVVGAYRTSLIGQFIGEALILTLFSVVIGILLVTAVLPVFNELTGKQLSLSIGSTRFWVALPVLLIVTGLVAGSYPAFFLSSLHPVKVLKGNLKFGQGATFFRKGLVVFQFVLSVILIVGMIVIYRQMAYVQSKNLGYDRENLVYIPVEGDMIRQYDLFKEQAAGIPGVVAISRMRQSPTDFDHTVGDVRWIGKAPEEEVPFADMKVGYDFARTLKLEFLDGHDFTPEFGTDSIGYMINETALKKIGYKDPIGQPIWWGNARGAIIGVLKDFHFHSMHQAIEPLIIRMDSSPKWSTMLVRIKTGRTTETLAGLEKIFKTLNPAFPFSYQFADQEYAKLYKSEQIVSRLSGYFACLATLISCLGLFGLATFSAEQRTREMGIRKVMGASVLNIVALFSSSFLKLVLIAFLLAMPVSWYIMNSWLQGFAYAVSIEWWIFAIAGLVTVSIALLTVGYQSIRAGMMNPIKSLNVE